MGQIGRKAGTTILHGPRTARTHGRPFNTLVTIRFWQLGSTAETIEKDFRFLKARWFQEAKIEALSVTENPICLPMGLQLTATSMRIPRESRIHIGRFMSAPKTPRGLLWPLIAAFASNSGFPLFPLALWTFEALPTMRVPSSTW